MDYNHPTPTSTRTYNDKDQQIARDYFDIDLLAKRLKPTEEEWARAFSAAIAMTAYKPEKGRRSAFPDAFQMFGIHDETEPFPRDKSYRTTGLLKLTHRIYSHLIDRVNNNETKTHVIKCPSCKNHTIEAEIGNVPKINGYKFGKEEKNIVSIKILCDCRDFTIKSLDKIRRDVRNNLAIQSF